MDRFPLPSSAAYSYAQGFTEMHRGVDIFAPQGTPVLAVEAGKAWSSLEGKGGKVVYLESATSGLRYFFGHLDSWPLPMIAATQAAPLNVAAGDEIGKVGNTGNAVGRPTHLHFQMRSLEWRGNTALDPFDALMRADPKKAGTLLPMRPLIDLNEIEMQMKKTALVWVFLFWAFRKATK